MKTASSFPFGRTLRAIQKRAQRQEFEEKDPFVDLHGIFANRDQLLLWVKSPRQPGPSPTSGPEGTPEGISSNPDIGARRSEAEGQADVHRTWPVRGKVANTRPTSSREKSMVAPNCSAQENPPRGPFMAQDSCDSQTSQSRAHKSVRFRLSDHLQSSKLASLTL